MRNGPDRPGAQAHQPQPQQGGVGEGQTPGAGVGGAHLLVWEHHPEGQASDVTDFQGPAGVLCLTSDGRHQLFLLFLLSPR